VHEEKPYTVVNAKLGWRSLDGRYGAAVWGENLSDTLYSLTLATGSFGTGQVLAKPRTYGVELTYHW
jgi:iron complex outermembrane receptor protein